MLVVDASVVLRACGIARGFEEFRGEELVGPPLMWSEARSVLHELRWRREVAPGGVPSGPAQPRSAGGRGVAGGR